MRAFKNILTIILLILIGVPLVLLFLLLFLGMSLYFIFILINKKKFGFVTESRYIDIYKITAGLLFLLGGTYLIMYVGLNNLITIPGYFITQLYIFIGFIPLVLHQVLILIIGNDEIKKLTKKTKKNGAKK